MRAVPILLTVQGPWKFDPHRIILMILRHIISQQDKYATHQNTDDHLHIHIHAKCISINRQIRHDRQNRNIQKISVIIALPIFFFLGSFKVTPRQNKWMTNNMSGKITTANSFVLHPSAPSLPKCVAIFPAVDSRAENRSPLEKQ